MENEFQPKEFLAINWSEKFDDSGEFLNEEFLIKHSATYKILNDEFKKVWSSDSEDEATQKNPPKQAPNQSKHQNQRKKHNTPYKPFTGFPKDSILTANIQEIFLGLMKKFNNYHSPFLSPQEQKELQTYTIIQEKVKKEQLEYLQFVREFAFANQSRYLSIKPGIRKYINELWKSQLQIPKRYPQFYETYRTVALVLSDSKVPFEMAPENISLQLGTVPRLSLNRYSEKIDTNYSTFVEKYPIINNETASSNLKKYPVSQDKNADHLAKLTNADFVISSSGLKRICDNHGPLFQKPWELPVTVKECETQEIGLNKTKRIIFIDKAFPKRKMTVVDKINWYHKIAIKGAIVNPSPTSVFRFDKSKNKGKVFKENTGNTLCPDTPTCSKNIDLKTVGSEDRKSAEDTRKDSTSAKGDQDNNSFDYSDSDEGNLVIEEESSIQELKDISTLSKEVNNIKAIDSPFSLKATAISPEASGPPVNPIQSIESGESGKKPLTRSMAKMLENINKVEKMIGKKGSDIVAKPSVSRKLTLGQNVELESANSSVETTDKVGQERKDDQKKNEKQPVKTAAPDKKLQMKDTINTSVLDELLEQQRKMLGNVDQKKIANLNSEKKYHVSSSVLELGDFTPVPPPEGSNFVYRLFVLRRKNPGGAVFRILVRCKYDAMEYCDRVILTTIVPKVEFQPEFGAECVTMSELTRQWLSLVIKPDSKLARARIDAFTSKINMIEEKEIKDFAREEKLLNTQASVCLNTLYSVLRGMSDIPPGQYVLSHDSKMGAFASLYRAVERQRDGSYDLHKQYEVDSSLEEPQSIANLWMELDFGIITPSHEALNRVPGTFNPSATNKKKGNKNRSKKKL